MPVARSVAECTSGEVAVALTRSFEGYLVPVGASARAYERRFSIEDLDPFSDRRAPGRAPGLARLSPTVRSRRSPALARGGQDGVGYLARV